MASVLTRLFGLSRLVTTVAALVAAVGLAVACPAHVLDLDDGAVAPPVAAVHHASDILDQAAPGHTCASHCGAHVLADIAQDPPPAAPIALTLRWPAALIRLPASHPASHATPPPRA